MEMAPSPVETVPLTSFVGTNEVDASVDSTDIHLQPKELESTPMDVSPSIPAAAPPTLIPSLKGLMTYSSGIVTCKGRWAMSDQAHEVEGQSSEFEFKLVKADVDGGFFPINGKYQGWFLIKQPSPLKGFVKVEDKDMIMKFVSIGDGSFSINGQGHNRLGKFNLRGTLTNDGTVHIYREYYHLIPVHIPQKRSSNSNNSSKKESIEKRKDPAVKDQPAEVNATPRESGSRIRKQSSLLKEFHDPLQKAPPVRTPSKDNLKTMNSNANALNIAERSHRLNTGLKKCADLLKELSRLPQSQWFLEPVDPVKFNIPDYPKIIKQPMDFSTIKSNIESGVYESINEFAEHMRLVFRNAITYNQARDSLVNIAAREISNKFEDKFRILVTQLDPSSMMLEPSSKGSKLGTLKRSKSRDFNPKPVKFPPGPRQFSSQFSLPPAAVDGSTMKILEMQQIIANMQDELKQLRTVVKESEISKRLNESKEAAQNPLTFDEKKALVAQIHKLPADKMERVLSIIQEAMPQCGDGVVEVPIDSLDTLTLRKLQSFVQANLTEKKKRQYTVKGDSANKRPRKARTPKSSATGEQLSSDDLGLFDNHDELLFEADSFEEIVKEEIGNHDSNEDSEAYARHVLAEYEKLKNNNNLILDENGNEFQIGSQEITNGMDSPHDGVTSSGNDVEEEDDDNLWSEAAAEMNKKQAYDVYQV